MNHRDVHEIELLSEEKVYSMADFLNKNQTLLEVYSSLTMILCNPQKSEQTLFGVDLGILVGIKTAEVVGTEAKGPRICQLSSL